MKEMTKEQWMEKFRQEVGEENQELIQTMEKEDAYLSGMSPEQMADMMLM